MAHPEDEREYGSRHPFESLTPFSEARLEDAGAYSLVAVEAVARVLHGGSPDFYMDDFVSAEVMQKLPIPTTAEVKATLQLEEDSYHDAEVWVFHMWNVDGYRVVRASGVSGKELLAPHWWIARP